MKSAEEQAHELYKDSPFEDPQTQGYITGHAAGLAEAKGAIDELIYHYSGLLQGARERAVARPNKRGSIKRLSRLIWKLKEVRDKYWATSEVGE